MRSNSDPSVHRPAPGDPAAGVPAERDKPLSFIEAARRKQIVDTAIKTIADRGYQRTSLAEIAREAGISKGVISYHFDGKDNLVEAVLARLLKEPADYIKRRVDAADRAIDKLRAYIRANFEFMKTHRDNYVALVDMWGGQKSPAGGNSFNANAYEPSRNYLRQILEMGQANGAFREMPLDAVASTIQGAIDGVMLQWVFDRNAVHLDKSCEEICQMISRHVR